MIKVIIFILINVHLYSSDLLKLHVSKNHTFLTFVESLSGAKYVSSVPKSIYLSKYKNDIQNFVKLHKEISKSKIKNYPTTKSLLLAFYTESLQYESFQGLKNKIKSFNVSIEKNKLNKYFYYLEKLYPRFEKILWNKTHKGLLYRKNKLLNLMKEKEFDKLVKKLLRFYNVSERKMGTMHIAFYPISYGRNINAYSMGNIESIGIFVGRSQNLMWMLTASILHELAHSIYSKSTVVQNNFLNIKDKKRKRTINEVLATAVGAGWGYNALTNKYSTRLWYNNKTYNKFGKLVYPEVKKYINNNKVIDKKFVEYIKELL